MQDAYPMPNVPAEVKKLLVDILATAIGTPTQKIMALLKQLGVDGTAELSAILGITKRAVQKANHSSRVRTTVRGSGCEPQFAGANHSSQSEGENEPQFAHQGANLSSPNPLLPPKKGLPQTPSKESPPSTHPKTIAAANNAARGEGAIEQPQQPSVETGRPDDDLLAAGKQIGIGEQSIEWLRRLYSSRIVKAALARLGSRMAAGEAVRRPAELLSRICADVQANPPKSVEHVPVGALVLSDGSIVSRW